MPTWGRPGSRALGGTALPWVWGEPFAADGVGLVTGCGDPRARLVTRALCAAASPETLFCWVCQLRRAPYSYDWLDNMGRRSPQRADPSLVHLRTGQRFMTIFTLVSCVPGASVTLTMRPGWPTRALGAVTVTYRVVPVAPDRTRIEVLMWLPPVGRVLARVRRDALAWGDVVMMRKQLRTLVRLAEGDDGTRHASANALPLYRGRPPGLSPR